MLKRLLVLLTVILLTTSCADDIEKMYSRYRAYFYYNKVQTTIPLYTALTSPGEFCSIKVEYPYIRFNSLTNSYNDPLNGTSMYKSYICISGFIVGKANMPENGAIELPTVCYDLACSNCYKEDGIRKPLSLKENGYAECERCKRTYDLNNQGMIYKGDKGVKLERYRVQYDANLIVNNQ